LTGCHREDTAHAQSLAPGLKILYKTWVAEGRPTEFNPTNYIKSSSDEFFVFTNTVQANGQAYHCRFAVRSPNRFGTNGVLAITDEQVILWVGASSNDIIVAPETKRSLF